MADVRELLAAATPRPWFVVELPWNDGTPWVATSDDPHGAYFIADLDCVAEIERVGDAIHDAELIVRAVNEYEALLDLEAVSRRPHTDPVLGARGGCRTCAALARLDEVRRG